MSEIGPIDPARLSLRQKRNKRQRLLSLILNSEDSELKPPEIGFPADGNSKGPVVEPNRVGLGIDFGTSAIAMALVGDAQRTVPFQFRPAGAEEKEPFPYLESSLARLTSRGHALLGDNYNLEDAYRLSVQSGWAFDPCLKRRIEWLARTRGAGDWQKSAVLDVAAVTIKALELARHPHGGPVRKSLRGFTGPVFVSLPNTFPRLGAAAVERGVAYGVAAALDLERLPPVRTLLEAEAVAYSELESGTEEGFKGALLVVDAGAGTTDASIVRRDGDSLRVVAHAGLPVGGIDLDALIALQAVEDFSRLDRGGMIDALRFAREKKEQYWGDPNLSVEEAIEAIANSLHDRQRGKEHPKPLAEITAGLTRGYQRYMSLAIDAVLRCLLANRRFAIERVVLSGRASLLLGFRGRVERCLEQLDCRVPISTAGTGEDLKLAVLRGVNAYAYGNQPSIERRPLRAGYELVLGSGPGEELCLLPVGSLLVNGWGVATWRQNTMVAGGSWPILARSLPRHIIEKLLENEGFGASRDEREILESWASRPVLRITGNPPFVDCCAYDFLTQKAMSRYGPPLEDLEAPDVLAHAGRVHPVHGAQEDWFEYFLGDRK
jgi:hypothetical protein